VVAIQFIWHWLFGGDGLDEASRKIEGVIERTLDLRRLFVDYQNFNPFDTLQSHSHPTAAKLRSAMNTWMKTKVLNCGYLPYNVSMSSQDAGERGCRLFYGLKDLSIPYQNDPIGDRDVLVMCDVDYYLDINEYLKYWKPILMYTFVPSSVAGKSNDIAYRFKDGMLEAEITGGASYRHKLWDYCGDVVSAIDDTGALLTFTIEQRNIPGDDLHKYIALLPSTRIPAGYWDHLKDQVRPISRKSVLQSIVNTHGEPIVVSQLFDPKTGIMSLARDGQWTAIDLPISVYEAIYLRLKNKPGDAVIADVERLLTNVKIPNAAINAALLFELMGVKPVKNIVTTHGDISYQPLGSLATEDGKPMGVQGTTPLVTEPAVVPTNSQCTDEATIRGRIDAVRNDKVPRSEYNKYADEFIRKVVPKCGVGVPISTEDVRKAQGTTQQRGRFALVAPTIGLGYLNQLKSFVKAEAYGSVNDPRNITTMRAENTVLLSCFTLSFKQDCLKRLAWYGPGLTPTGTVRRLREVLAGGVDTLAVDYSRLDGTVSEFLQRRVVMAAYMTWAHPDYRVELKNHLQQVFVQTGHTRHGVKFNPGYGTRSGSPTTTDGNTLICGFVNYCALRKLGLNADEAFDEMGLVYGDDGVFAATSNVAGSMETVARELGLKLKASIIAAGDPVPYLGRIFPSPLTSASSFQDPIRTLSKIHITTNKSVSIEQAMANKCYGYLTTDAKTPLISNYCKRVLAITGITRARGALHEEQFRMSNAWPQTDEVLIEETMCKVLNVTRAELKAACARIDDVSSLDQFPVVLSTLREIKIPAVLCGEIVEPERRNNVETRYEHRRVDQQGQHRCTQRIRRYPQDNGGFGKSASAQRGKTRQVGGSPSKGEPRKGRGGPQVNKRRPMSSDTGEADILPSVSTLGSGCGPT
jgi:hypothetical protein